MEQKNWDKFLETGSVIDYLSYRLAGVSPSYRHGKGKCAGVRDCESDCTDRDGALHSTSWGI